MAYAFNDDKSKAEVYDKTEVNDLFKVVAVTSIEGSGSSVEPNKTASPYRYFEPPEGYSVVGIVGLKPSSSPPYYASHPWNIMQFEVDHSGGANRISCVVQNVSEATRSVIVTFYVLLVKTDFIDK